MCASARRFLAAAGNARPVTPSPGTHSFFARCRACPFPVLPAVLTSTHCFAPLCCVPGSMQEAARMADGSRTAELEADAAAAEAASEARAEVLQRTAKTVTKAPEGKAEKRSRRAKAEFAEFVVDVWITNFN